MRLLIVVVLSLFIWCVGASFASAADTNPCNCVKSVFNRCEPCCPMTDKYCRGDCCCWTTCHGCIVYMPVTVCRDWYVDRCCHFCGCDPCRCASDCCSDWCR
jgi:hypothetical protein